MSSILIIGGGLAGLFAALKLAPHPCTVLSPVPLGQGASSAWAQGGIAAAIGEGDSIESHVADTLVAGAGLSDAQMVRLMASQANDRIHDLLAYGVPFDRDLEGRLVQSREAAHSAKRIVRVKGDMAGKAIMEALVTAVRTTPSIRVIEGAEAESLKVKNGRVCGAHIRLHAANQPDQIVEMDADATILATGGIGHLYAVTTNPSEARGLGLAMAAEAGASIINAEFVQFHPTAIDIGRDPAPLATEALRGEGAVLINAAGERFMRAIHKDAELAPRDIVARGVFAELVAGRRPMLDTRNAIGAAFAEHFPGVYATCIAAGIDPVRAPIPVTPAEHYHMGGIRTDENGASSVPGLYAIGEVACTGVHGANRLASNSLLEAIVFAARAAAVLKTDKAEDVVLHPARLAAPWIDESATITRLRGLMARNLGVIRDGAGMSLAFDAFQQIERDARSTTLKGMAQVAMMIAHAGLIRLESRGGHFRMDTPNTDALAHASEALPLHALRHLTLTSNAVPPAA